MSLYLGYTWRKLEGLLRYLSPTGFICSKHLHDTKFKNYLKFVIVMIDTCYSFEMHYTWSNMSIRK